jgi:hypothetical protein
MLNAVVAEDVEEEKYPPASVPFIIHTSDLTPHTQAQKERRAGSTSTRSID